MLEPLRCHREALSTHGLLHPQGIPGWAGECSGDCEANPAPCRVHPCPRPSFTALWRAPFVKYFSLQQPLGPEPQVSLTFILGTPWLIAGVMWSSGHLQGHLPWHKWPGWEWTCTFLPFIWGRHTIHLPPRPSGWITLLSSPVSSEFSSLPGRYVPVSHVGSYCWVLLFYKSQIKHG